MGQIASAPSSTSSSSSSSLGLRTKQPYSCPSGGVTAVEEAEAAPAMAAEEGGRDHTAELPDELLAVIFHGLGPGDRNRCALVCRRWLGVEGQSRRRIAVDARAALLEAAPALFGRRFCAVSRLALRCDRRSDSIGDAALAAVALRCPALTRLKLRSCRSLSDSGMSGLAAAAPALRKLSVASCSFGAPGVLAVLRGCPLLEELSLKRLRGLDSPLLLFDDDDDDSAGDTAAPAPASSSLRSICFKELYNAQCFAPLILGAPNLKSLKLFRCSGDWDPLLEALPAAAPALAEVHLEKLQVSDRGLAALALCADLHVLHLVKTPECTDAGLAPLLARCRRLRKVHLDGWKTNRIGDPSLSALARACPDLQELVLIGVNPTARSLEPVAANCRALERLALCGCDTFGDAELACVAAKCAALKKLCVKGCPVTDVGLGALADGCPKLVKVKIKKCRGVTPECAEWLRTVRSSLAINLDTDLSAAELQEGSVSESGVLEDDGDDKLVPDTVDRSELPTSSTSRPTSPWKARISSMVGRNFLASAIRRWSHGSSCSRNS
ncbi:F-box protein At1g47056-like [Ananas comosus]|uniref:F-box protein n=2 Tax=Ananas comosus TaxID=4615 RepID=A0A199V256_ANACO|nr:F-box protein At1g47056-like [Ananas comosus]OAY71157.1 F-box protein [Ananas comosus]CAD1831774.1 unnamed protein product [Ananas comosus var. bracteatus]